MTACSEICSSDLFTNRSRLPFLDPQLRQLAALSDLFTQRSGVRLTAPVLSSDAMAALTFGRVVPRSCDNSPT
jgi:hypothetical protein